ncbi:MAG: TolC family protein, partial [Gemmatimonadota bacterium]
RHRQVLIGFRRIEAARAAVQLATRNVAEQEARLGLGLATARQVLDAQDDLGSARVSLQQAIVDYDRARILWEQLVGE